MRQLGEWDTRWTRSAGTLVVAPLHERHHVTLQRPQFRQVRANGIEVPTRDVSSVGAVPAGILDQLNQRAYLLDGKSEISASPDERQPAHVAFAVATWTTSLSIGGRQETDLLVKADRWRRRARGRGEGADLQQGGGLEHDAGGG